MQRSVSTMLAMLLIACLAGCAGPAAAPAAPTPVPEPPTAVPEPPTATPVPPPPAPAVLPEQGTLEQGSITSPALAGNLVGDPATRRYFIYLPPSYHVSDKRYPVFYMLHANQPPHEQSWTPIRGVLDSMIQEGKIGEMIVVFPNVAAWTGTRLTELSRLDGMAHASWLRASPVTGDYETYLAHDLVDAIDAAYRTIAHRDSRAIGGYGCGANGALHLALTHPDVFGAVAAEFGFYDVETEIDNLLRAYKYNPPVDTAQAVMANSVAAVVSPNPDRPPFFLDPLVQQIDGEWGIPPDVRERIRLLNPIADLEGYAKQPTRLRGISIVHPARSPGFVADVHAKPLVEAMTALGIDHEYILHDGAAFDTGVYYSMLLEFLARTLVFEQE
jgi:hypothetical protein